EAIRQLLGWSFPRVAPARASWDGKPVANFEDVGPDERRDPYYFGASLARLIASCDGQDIGTYTFSHLCALEQGETIQTFATDTFSVLLQLREWGIQCRSIAFPRNQY